MIDLTANQIINACNDDLWKIIEFLEWSKDHNFKRIRKQLHNMEFKEVLSSFAHAKQYALQDKFHDSWLDNDSCGGIDVSDDGWQDLTAEVVGRGREFYENITLEQLQEMADNRDYSENFMYSFQ